MFDWGKYLEFSDRLIQEEKGIDEAKFRTAVSRAYYSVHHAALKMAMRSFGYEFSSERERGRHADLYREIAKQSIPGLADLAKDLIAFHERRVGADYKGSVCFSRADARLSILMALDILKRCQTIK